MNDAIESCNKIIESFSIVKIIESQIESCNKIIEWLSINSFNTPKSDTYIIPCTREILTIKLYSLIGFISAANRCSNRAQHSTPKSQLFKIESHRHVQPHTLSTLISSKIYLFYIVLGLYILRKYGISFIKRSYTPDCLMHVHVNNGIL